MKPHFVRLFSMSALALVLALSSAWKDLVCAQERPNEISTEAAHGFSMYQSGDTRAALNVLRERVRAKADDPDAWHYLGIISMKSGDFKGAVESFQKAIGLRPNYVASRTGLSYSLLLSHKYDEAKVEAEQVLKQNQRSDEAHYILELSSSKRGISGESRSKAMESQSLTTKPKIISKPNPQFSREDIKGLQQARVSLAFVVTEYGEVKYIMVIKSLGYELTKKAVEAARNMKFEPAQKDGRPVSVVSSIEYDFTEMLPTSNSTN